MKRIIDLKKIPPSPDQIDYKFISGTALSASIDISSKYHFLLCHLDAYFERKKEKSMFLLRMMQ